MQGNFESVEYSISGTYGLPILDWGNFPSYVLFAFKFSFLHLPKLFVVLQSVQQFVEYQYQKLKLLQRAKIKKNENKAEIIKLKKKVSVLKAALDSKSKELEFKSKELADNNSSHEQELQFLRDQSAILQKSLYTKKMTKKKPLKPSRSASRS